MKLYPKQYKDLCDHDECAYAGTIYNGDQLVDIYFLYAREAGRSNIGVCIREGDNDPSEYASGSLDQYICPMGFGEENNMNTMKYIRPHEKFRLNIVALFFKWAVKRRLTINPKLIHSDSNFSKSNELFEYEYKKANEDRNTTTNRNMVA